MVHRVNNFLQLDSRLENEHLSIFLRYFYVCVLYQRGISFCQGIRLTDFIEAIEAATGKQAKRNLMPMHAGDVPATWADASLLKELTGYSPKTTVTDGVKNFVDWYRDFYCV